ncbi:MAG: cytochrome C oxidase subunit IV family protein [Gemmatimonadota bacterium]
MDNHHVVPIRVYLAVAACLFLFTGLTVLAAFVHIGHLNTPLALGIAVLKASLVVLFFMHVRYSSPLMWVFAGGGFFWLLIMLALTLQDYVSRPWDGPAPVEFLTQVPALP